MARSKRILIVTSSNETNVSRVLEYFSSTEPQVFRLDTDRLLEDTVFTCMTTRETKWSISSGENVILSDEIISIWYRRPDDPKAGPEVASSYREFVETEGKKFLRNLWSVTSEQGIFWLNHPRVLRTMEANKLFQLQLADQVGLRIPETIITNDPSAAKDFFHRWGEEVIVKTFGGVSMQGGSGQERVIYTNRVTKEYMDRFSEDIRHGPIMLQNYIPKTLELRITAVGDSLFTCAIHSQDSPKTTDDWRRYDFKRVRHAIFELPVDIKDKLIAFMRLAELQFGAIDMILTPQGEYVFLEVNPSGQWQWIEALTDLPISKAIAELLANPPKK